MSKEQMLRDAFKNLCNYGMNPSPYGSFDDDDISINRCASERWELLRMIETMPSSSTVEEVLNYLMKNRSKWDDLDPFGRGIQETAVELYSIKFSGNSVGKNEIIQEGEKKESDNTPTATTVISDGGHTDSGLKATTSSAPALYLLTDASHTGLSGDLTDNPEL